MAQEPVTNAHFASTARWYLAFCISSVGMQIVNKAIALRMSKALDSPLMIVQNLTAMVLDLVIVAFAAPEMKHIWRINRIRRQHVVRLMLPSANFVFMLFCSIKALRTVSVATVVVARNVCACGVAFGEMLVFRRRHPPMVWASMLVTIAGSIIYAYNDLHFSSEGYFWQGLNSLFFVTGQLYEKWAVSTTSDQTPLGVSFLKNMWSLPVSLGLMVVLEDLSALAPAVGLVTASCWVMVVLSGIGCFGLSLCYMTLYKISSATSITVASNMNKVLTILVAQLIFGNTLGLQAFLGLAICILGSLWYSYLGLQQFMSLKVKTDKIREGAEAKIN